MPLRFRLAVGLGVVAVGLLGWILFAVALLSSPQQPGDDLPRPESTAATDRAAVVLVDDAAGDAGPLVGSILEVRSALGSVQARVRLDNRTSGDVPLGQTDFTMPDATPPIAVVSPALPDILPPGNAVETTLTFTGVGQALLWCPSARPGTCIRL